MESVQPATANPSLQDAASPVQTHMQQAEAQPLLNDQKIVASESDQPPSNRNGAATLLTKPMPCDVKAAAAQASAQSDVPSDARSEGASPTDKLTEPASGAIANSTPLDTGSDRPTHHVPLTIKLCSVVPCLWYKVCPEPLMGPVMLGLPEGMVTRSARSVCGEPTVCNASGDEPNDQE